MMLAQREVPEYLLDSTGVPPDEYSSFVQELQRNTEAQRRLSTARVHLTRGLMLQNEGKLDDANFHYRLALNFVPNFRAALQSLEETEKLQAKQPSSPRH